jgi:hypothetical protein
MLTSSIDSTESKAGNTRTLTTTVSAYDAWIWLVREYSFTVKTTWSWQGQTVTSVANDLSDDVTWSSSLNFEEESVLRNRIINGVGHVIAEATFGANYGDQGASSLRYCISENLHSGGAYQRHHWVEGITSLWETRSWSVCCGINEKPWATK